MNEFQSRTGADLDFEHFDECPGRRHTVVIFIRLMTMQESNPSAAKLKTLVPRCTVCSKDLSGHNFALIATTVAAEENRTRVEALFGHVRRHEWNALVGYGDFRPDENAALVYSITGPHEGGMVILIRDPSDLYEPADLYLQEQLSKEEIATVTALARAGDWQKL